MARATRYLLDSDLLIAWVCNQREARVALRKLRPGQLGFSVVTYIEVSRGEFSRDARFVRTIQGLFGEGPIFPLTIAIAEHAAREGARLRRENQQMSLGDLAIASTAALDGRTLLTRNLEHFRLFRGLKLEAW